jgi:hypothetical protein
VLLVDESAAMETPLSKDPAATGPTKAAALASAINAVLNKLSSGTGVELAIVGYRTDANDAPSVGCRWSGPLAGREFVQAGELAAAPAQVEQRVRRLPGPTGLTQEQTVAFPVWYQPQTGGKSPQLAAYEFCQQLLTNWLAAAGTDATAPLIVNLFAGPSSDGNPLRAVQQFQQLACPAGTPLILQAHLVASASSPVLATLYPANRAYLPSGAVRDLFPRASVLPDAYREALSKLQAKTDPSARGLIYNARMVDVARFLSLVQTYAAAIPPSLPIPVSVPVSVPVPARVSVPESLPESLPPPEAAPLAASAPEPEPAPPPAVLGPGLGRVALDQPALVVFVLDRSLQDPYAKLDAEAAPSGSAFDRLQERLGDLAETLAKFGRGAVDVGVVTYGCDDVGAPDVRAVLEGGLAGRSFARDQELMSGAIRVVSAPEEMSDGAGGIMLIPHDRPILVDVEPSPAAPAAPAFARVAELITSWAASCPGNQNSPLVLHLTRGQLDVADAEQAVAQLQALPAVAPVAVYHVVETETPCAALLCPDSEPAAGPEQLQWLWRLSSPLVGREVLAAEKPTVSAQARGFVVNGRCQLLLDAVKRAASAG